MKELLETKRRPEQEKVQQQKKQYTLLGSMRKKSKNHKLWELDLKKMELKEVFLEAKAIVDTKGKTHICSRATYRDGCMYVQALNRENAARKFDKKINATFSAVGKSKE